MVYYFTSNVVDPPATIYVGKDKFESLLHSFLSIFLLSHPILFHLTEKGLDYCVWCWAGLYYYLC